VPELPEVEAARKEAMRQLKGRRIVAASCLDDEIVLDGGSPPAVEKALRGATTVDSGRHGKYLWFELDRKPWPVFHFGMTGGFHYRGEGEPAPRFLKLDVALDDGRRFAFTDPRRFGRLRFASEPRNESPLRGLGPDPLRGLPPLREIADQLARRHAPIKAVLLDQTVFAGVGNWIADEVLYQARLRPDRPASSLSRAEVASLRKTLLAIIRRAVSVDADADRFPKTWLFHHRWGRVANSMTARGEAIVHHTIGGRTTAWAPTRQR
jgi:formamidopyrimidine-DNA glycosylase